MTTLALTPWRFIPPWEAHDSADPAHDLFVAMHELCFAEGCPRHRWGKQEDADMASGVDQEYEVLLNDDSLHVVNTDQRDWVQMEVREFPRDAILTKARFLVFNAMKRQGLIRSSWEQFNGAKCVRVKAIDKPDESVPGDGEEEDTDPLA